jgi:hypothetical protein
MIEDMALRLELTFNSAVKDVWESGSVDERAVYLLCGNADFQVRSQMCRHTKMVSADGDLRSIHSFRPTRSRSTAS